MPRGLLVVTGALAAVAVVMVFVLYSYYFGFWPEPGLDVDDPVIAEWLERESVVVYRRGRESTLEDAVMYVQQGRMADGSCRWTTRLSMGPGETGVRVARALAVDRTTCEKLVVEGVPRK